MDESAKRRELWEELRRVEADCDDRQIDVASRLTRLETVQTTLTKLSWMILAAVLAGEAKDLAAIFGG